MAAARIGLASLVLLPPTVAMGATLPVVARGLVSDDGTLGRWSAILYAANTFGAVLGAYLCGFWLVPELGLTRAVLAAGVVNLGVAAFVLVAAGSLRAPATPAAGPSNEEVTVGRRPIAAFLFFFGVSGFVAIGYEIIWSKAFGIVMEGTLYGFAAVLSAYLLGIGLGSAAIASRVDRIRDLPRAFALLHVAIGMSVIAGISAVPYLPFVYARLTDLAQGDDAVHWLYLLVLPIVLVPTALFGAAFPVLVRIVTPRARNVARGMGVATAVNTAGSIAASLIVGFWWIPKLGSDATLYLLLLLDFGVALTILGLFSEAAPRSRARALAGVVPLVAVLSLSYGGIRLEDAIAGRQVKARNLAGYARSLRAEAGTRLLTLEGKSSIVSVTGMPTARLLHTNGLPEAGFRFAPPYYPREAIFLGLVPYLTARKADRALVIGLGGGNTVTSLLHTRVSRVDVVELEQAVVEAAGVMHRGRTSPLDDPRVTLHVDDGRNDLLRRTRTGARGYDLIVSQPSHPWRIGAASLFTEEFFHVARAALDEGGVFAAWLNGFRIDPEAALAVVASFERVFPGSLLVDIGAKGRLSFLLLGGRSPVELDVETMARRLAEPDVAALAAGYGVHGVEDVLADIEGPSAVFAALRPKASNTDDNAFVETRAPRALSWRPLDFAAIESLLAPDDPVLPPWRGSVDVASVGRSLLAARDDTTYVPKLRRLLAAHGEALDACDAGTLRATALLREPTRESEGLEQLRALARTHPSRPEPLRVLGTHLATRRAQWRDAARSFAEAFERSGASTDAYDAGRALDHVDREEAWRWFERIAGTERDRYPRLAFYAARRTLARGSDGDALRAAYVELSSFLARPEGREFPGAHALASRLAWARGDAASARAHADADARQRRDRAAPLIARARSALAAGRIDEARVMVEDAGRLDPLSEAVMEMRTRIAMTRGSPEDVERSISLLRSWAPNVQQAIAAENRLRDLHGLPLTLEAAPHER